MPCITQAGDPTWVTIAKKFSKASKLGAFESLIAQASIMIVLLSGHWVDNAG